MNRYRCWAHGWGAVREVPAINPLAAARRYAQIEGYKGEHTFSVYNVETDELTRFTLHVSPQRRRSRG